MIQNKFNQIIQPIGYVTTNEKEIPRHYSLSEVEGQIVLDEEFLNGIKDYTSGDPDRIMVIFLFHESPPFSKDKLMQLPPTRNDKRGVFLTCSPIRPNPFGVSILKVLDIKKNIIRVKGLDILDRTPIIDIKPWKDTFNIS